MSDVDQGSALLSMRRYEGAVAAALRALAADPDSIAAHELLVDAFLHSGQPDQALKAVQAALATSPENARFQHLRGMALVRLRQFSKAAEAFRTALSRDADNAATHANLALCLANLRDHTRAEAHAASALELAPWWSEAHRIAGDVALRFKQWATAEEHYRDALALDPENRTAQTNLGSVLARRGRLEEAINVTVSAAKLDPMNRTATGNVVSLSKGFMARSGAILFPAVMLIRLLPDDRGPLGWFATGVYLLILATIYVWQRRKRFEQLPHVAQNAVLAQRRREGPGSMATWTEVAYLGGVLTAMLFVGVVLAPDPLLVVLVVLGLMVTAGGIGMVLFKLPHFDARTEMRTSFSAWIGLGVLTAAVSIGAVVALVSPGGSTLPHVFFLIVAAPLLGISLYGIAQKRPIRS